MNRVEKILKDLDTLKASGTQPTSPTCRCSQCHPSTALKKSVETLTPARTVVITVISITFIPVLVYNSYSYDITSTATPMLQQLAPLCCEICQSSMAIRQCPVQSCNALLSLVRDNKAWQNLMGKATTWTDLWTTPNISHYKHYMISYLYITYICVCDYI
jgi:hypothetical protein